MRRFNHIWKYFRGRQVGKEANRLEREALSDPFLYEALEGLSGIKGVHEQIVNGLQRQIQCGSCQKRGRIVYRWLAAASFVLIGGLAILMMNRQAQQPQEQLAVNKFVMPDNVEGDIEERVSEIKLSAAMPEVRRKSGGKQEEVGMVLAAADVVKPVDAVHENNKADKIRAVQHHKVVSASKSLFFKSKETEVTQKQDSDTLRMPGESQSGEAVVMENIIHGKTSYTGSAIQLSIQEQTDAERLRKFMLYVADSLRFPKDAKFQGIKGEVHLSVRLNKRGRPSRIKIVKPLSPSCDKEAVRIVQSYTGDLGTSERIVLIIPFK